ncbi:MAG: TlpA family protein disulfide reductase [Phycisphaerae bacterium]|nr:TlpA family protein disulfide reductase [Phycisphaerae bacterium]
MKNARKLVVFFIMLVYAANLFAGNLIGKNAPNIVVDQWITRANLDAEDLRGKVVVVEFWATWCHSCVEFVPHLIELNNKYSPKGLVFVSISQDRSADLVRDFIKEKGINYHVAIDRGTADWFGVTCYPTAFVIDHNGFVIWKGFPWDKSFEKTISKALDRAGPPLLAGVDLGEFKKYKKQLYGGKDFSKAYQKIASYASDADSQFAKKIINCIDNNINNMIRNADMLKEDDPVAALEIYANIVNSYSGIKSSESAINKYHQLKKYIEIAQPTLLVAKKIQLLDTE